MSRGASCRSLPFVPDDPVSAASGMRADLSGTSSVAVAAAPCAPDVVGLSLREAQDSAESRGLRLAVSSCDSSRGPWGIVVAQSPVCGSRLMPRWRLHVLIADHPGIDLEGSEAPSET